MQTAFTVCVCVERRDLREGISDNVVPADVELEEEGVPHSRQESVDNRPLSLVDVTGSVVQQQLLHLVGRAEDEGVLEKREHLPHEGVAEELIVVDHVDAAVEFLVAKLLPLERRSKYVDRVNLWDKWQNISKIAGNT